MSRKRWYVIAAIIILASGGTAVYYKVRGLRNNNPGNIRYNPANDWKGQTGYDGSGEKRSDGTIDWGMAKFKHHKWGIRAIGKTIDSYKRRGVLSVEQIISTWAPAIENNVDAYIASVRSKTGWPRGYVPVREEGDYLPLVKAIITHENGMNPYSDSEIKEALNLS